MASETAALLEGSTLKDSAIQLTATSIDSWSSAGSVPSVTEVDRKSQIASARRCLDVVACGQEDQRGTHSCQSRELLGTGIA